MLFYSSQLPVYFFFPCTVLLKWLSLLLIGSALLPLGFAFKQTFELESSTSSRYWRWVAQTRYSEYQVYLQEIEFELAADWGWAFIGVLLLLAGLYVAGFGAHNYKVKGLRGKVSAATAVPYCGCG